MPSPPAPTHMLQSFPFLLKGLEIYETIHGHGKVPTLFVVPAEDPSWPAEMVGFKLGYYVKEARYYKRQEVLTKMQIRALNRIGMVWDASGATVEF